MTFVVIIEPNHLLRLGIQQILSATGTPLELVGYDSVHVNRQTSFQPCNLAILSISRADELVSVMKNVEETFQPKAVLLLCDSVEIPPSVHTASPLVAGCIYKYAEPEILQASTKLVLAGGRCFPSGSWPQGAQGQLLSQYEPMKWPQHGKEVPTLQSRSTPEAIVCAADLESENNQLNPENIFSETRAPTGTRNPACHESEMLGLTPRQYEVLVLLARGYPMKTVGRHLNISVATAKAHTESLYQRLDVKNRNAAVYTAISRGATLGWTSITGHPEPNQTH